MSGLYRHDILVCYYPPVCVFQRSACFHTKFNSTAREADDCTELSGEMQMLGKSQPYALDPNQEAMLVPPCIAC